MKCAGCGNEFVQVRSTHLYCGRRCYYEQWKKQKKEGPKQYYDSVCVVCGTPIRSTRKRRRYCSVRCHWTDQNSKRQTTQELDRSCSVCGKMFKPLQKRGAGKQVCSEQCRLARRKLLRVRRFERLSDGTTDGIKRVRRNDNLQIYGLSVEKYETMFAEQNGLCAICGKPETMKTSKGYLRALSVDHCHKRAHVRKLLCAKCNQGIGLFFDDPDLLRAAATYLEKHE